MSRQAGELGVERLDEHLGLPEQYRSGRSRTARSSPHQSIAFGDTIVTVWIILKEAMQPAKNQVREFGPNGLQFVESVADIRKAKPGAPVFGKRSIRGDRGGTVSGYRWFGKSRSPEQLQREATGSPTRSCDHVS
jgi:hypothetical protein